MLACTDMVCPELTSKLAVSARLAHIRSQPRPRVVKWIPVGVQSD